MNILNRLFPVKKIVLQEPRNADVVLANGQTDKRDVDDPTSKFCGPIHVGFETNRSTVRRKDVSYQRSEYDLETLANAVQLDGILRRTVNIYTEQILKNGYELNSQNDKIQKHTKNRIKEIQYFTGISFIEILSQICSQLVTYGNAYVIKERGKNLSQFGKPYRLYGRDNDPIVGIFVADASTMEVGLNNKGNLVTYKQKIRGESSEWDERDVIHFTYNKIPGCLTGQSPIIPVLDDVRALRKLEEEIEILGFQYSIPLYLYKVGNKDIPAAPGEIETVSSTIANMPTYGMLVVPGHHDITIPSNSSNVMDIIKYVDHFKSRIYGGLGVSPVALGQIDTSNRNTSQVADMGMQTITKSYQQIIKNKLELDLLREFLLDGNYSKLEDEIEFVFPEIDIETQIKKETHIIAKWQNNLITRTESRNEMTYENAINDEDTFLRLVDIPKIEAQTEGQMMVAKTKAAVAPATSKNAKSTSNKVAPRNQHGKSTRPKYVKSSTNIYGGLTIFNKDSFSTSLEEKINNHLKDHLDIEIAKLCSFYHKDLFEPDSLIVSQYFSAISLLISDKVNRASKHLDDINKLDLINQQTKKFIEDQEDKIHNLAKILMFKSLGIDTILITSANCDEHADTTFNISQMDYSKIPPFGYKCKCEINEEKLNG
jgi:hypothetical protein